MNVKKHAEKLREDGIVIIEEYLDEGVCDDVYEEASTIIEEEHADVVESDEYDYDDLVNWGDTAIRPRTGRDEGMIDTFNIDKRISQAAKFKNDQDIKKIINESKSGDYSPDNVNAYWNRSVTQTRGFHADNYNTKFKSFLYLTDVPDLSYGPFAYIKGTHEPSQLKQTISGMVNRLKGTKYTDAVFYDESNKIHCTASKGTLIIANQSGYHRGHPQEEDKERMLLTTSYTQDSN